MAIKIKPQNKGTLRKAMGTPKGKNIPADAEAKKLAAAKKSGNKKMVKKLVFAMNARKWNKSGGGSKTPKGGK